MPENYLFNKLVLEYIVLITMLYRLRRLMIALKLLISMYNVLDTQDKLSSLNRVFLVKLVSEFKYIFRFS